MAQSLSLQDCSFLYLIPSLPPPPSPASSPPAPWIIVGKVNTQQQPSTKQKQPFPWYRSNVHLLTQSQHLALPTPFLTVRFEVLQTIMYHFSFVTSQYSSIPIAELKKQNQPSKEPISWVDSPRIVEISLQWWPWVLQVERELGG
jgi:hypothetical protein